MEQSLMQEANDMGVFEHKDAQDNVDRVKSLVN
jgi:hypothetical protein